jgi:putative IMPACT (imprinted ancient) family translation regulator
MLIAFRGPSFKSAARRFSKGSGCDGALPINSKKYQLISSHHYEEVIKKSKFSCIVAPVKTAAEAEAVIRDFRDPHATHTCWAYVVENCERCSDDGEPSGTAGRPMISAIHSENITDSVAAMNRYYGGIKLGTGGLARAFGGITKTCIQLAPKLLKTNRCTVTLITNFELSPLLHRVLRRPGNSVVFHSEEVLQTEGPSHESGAALRMVFSVEAVRQAEIIGQLKGACKGAITFEFTTIK